MAWLDRLSLQLAETRDAARERVTAVADDLAQELQRMQRELAQAQARIAELVAENTRLRQALSAATVAL